MKKPGSTACACRPSKHPIQRPSDRCWSAYDADFRNNFRIHYREAELRETVKAAGGQWQPQERLWKLSYETVIKLGLDKRIIQFVMSNQA